MFSPHTDGRGTAHGSFSIRTATTARARRWERYLRKFRKRIEREAVRYGATTGSGICFDARGATKLARRVGPTENGSPFAAGMAPGPQASWRSAHSAGWGARGTAPRSSEDPPKSACSYAPYEAEGIGDAKAGDEAAAPASTKANTSTSAGSKPPAAALNTANSRNLIRNRILIVYVPPPDVRHNA